MRSSIYRESVYCSDEMERTERIHRKLTGNTCRAYTFSSKFVPIVKCFLFTRWKQTKNKQKGDLSRQFWYPRRYFVCCFQTKWSGCYSAFYLVTFTFLPKSPENYIVRWCIHKLSKINTNTIAVLDKMIISGKYTHRWLGLYQLFTVEQFDFMKNAQFRLDLNIFSDKCSFIECVNLWESLLIKFEARRQSRPLLFDLIDSF